MLSASHFVFEVTRWSEAPRAVANEAGWVSVDFPGASTSMIVAAEATSWTAPVAPWLHVSSKMSASLVAREIGTLSHLVELNDVVLTSSDGELSSHARIIHELLTSDPATITNSAASIVNAYNRPLPPRPLTIWICSGLSSDDVVELVNIFVDPPQTMRSTRLN